MIYLRNTYRTKSFLIWTFSVLALIVFSNTSAIQSGNLSYKFTNEQIDSDRSAQRTPFINYSCASSVLLKRNAPEKFNFMSQSPEITLGELINIKYRDHKVLNKHTIDTSIVYLITINSTRIEDEHLA